jgi:glycosyltransferase involved in cell wall biosynthesis
MLQVLFYCESSIFGGHEKMAIAAHQAVERWSVSVRIEWLVNRDSRLLIRSLDQAGLKYSLLAGERDFSLWRHPVRALQMIRRNAAIMRNLHPHLVVIVQGGILLSFGGILAARLAGMRYCSYIPMVHSYSETHPSRIPYLTDAVWRLLYQFNRRYITIDREQAARLRRESRRSVVEIVENCVPAGEPLTGDRPAAREALGIPARRKVLSVIGRIEFAQKCQDWVVRSLKDDLFMRDKMVLFVGDGSDGPALRDMVSSIPGDHFRVMDWTQDLRGIYAATDVLVIPSKVEGVPLVMLEALGYGIPVVGTDRDGMRDWLPKEWRFRWNHVEGLRDAINAGLASVPDNMWESLRTRLDHVHDQRRFGIEFENALVRFSRP